MINVGELCEQLDTDIHTAIANYILCVCTVHVRVCVRVCVLVSLVVSHHVTVPQRQTATSLSPSLIKRCE